MTTGLPPSQLIAKVIEFTLAACGKAADPDSVAVTQAYVETLLSNVDVTNSKTVAVFDYVTATVKFHQVPDNESVEQFLFHHKGYKDTEIYYLYPVKQIQDTK